MISVSTLLSTPVQTELFSSDPLSGKVLLGLLTWTLTMSRDGVLYWLFCAKLTTFSFSPFFFSFQFYAWPFCWCNRTRVHSNHSFSPGGAGCEGQEANRWQTRNTIQWRVQNLPLVRTVLLLLFNSQVFFISQHGSIGWESCMAIFIMEN